ncbi:MAG TPA: ABC transporter permease [Solirubrobacteraceae bacterium]|nr:ABC transporter permease [Solirubrobacteraceae bacterium]
MSEQTGSRDGSWALRFAEGLARLSPLIDDTPAVASGAEPLVELAAPTGRRNSTWVLRRVLFGLFTLLVISILIFFATHVLPGNAAEAILGHSATRARVAQLERQLGLDRPVVSQYWSWLSSAVHGDFGTSLAANEPVTTLIGSPLVNTLVLLGLTALFAVPISLFIGVLAATRQNGVLDGTISAASITLAALPEFVIGIILVTLFATQVFKLLPAVSLVSPGQDPLSTPTAMILPVATLTLAVVPYLSRLVRGSMIDVLGSEYVTMARLKGLRPQTILVRHVLRNALVPAIQGTALSLAYLLGGVVTIEYLFAYPGLGSALIAAAGERDIPVIQAICLIFAAGYVIFNIIADLLTIYVTPRLRTQ